MKLFTYTITRDFGFAPNPYGGFCTLATCKPGIRCNASIGDWVIATGPKTSYNKYGYLFYAMKVEEKIKFDEYWIDPRFQYKKPTFNGSLKQCFGDNIYFFDKSKSEWHQEDSHHSFENGVVNNANLNNDTSSPFVLISQHFYYFGKSNIDIPDNLKEKVCHNLRVPTYKIVEEAAAIELIDWLEKNNEMGIHNDPMEFDNGFQRYKG